jgi:hypothetical protein
MLEKVAFLGALQTLILPGAGQRYVAGSLDKQKQARMASEEQWNGNVR